VEARDALDEVISAFERREIDRDEFKVRALCIVLKTRVLFMNAWKYRDPLIQVDNEGQIVRRAENERDPAAGGRISHPGFTIMSTNASPATRDRLRL
jgi:hypothetical protein